MNLDNVIPYSEWFAARFKDETRKCDVCHGHDEVICNCCGNWKACDKCNGTGHLGWYIEIDTGRSFGPDELNHIGLRCQYNEQVKKEREMAQKWAYAEAS